jgi:HPt (histidine-containing phosphotransfer) domain-containing protein
MNLSLLKSLMSGDERLVSHFISIFKTQVPPQVGMLPGLYNAQEWEELSTALHSLKTQFNYVGLTEFAERMQEMEDQVDSGQTLPISSGIKEFTAKFNQYWQTEFNEN